MDKNTTRQILRVLAGVLALACFVIVVIRFHGAGSLPQDEQFLHFLRLIFPLSLGLMAGYLAVTGKFPFAGKK